MDDELADVKFGIEKPDEELEDSDESNEKMEMNEVKINKIKDENQQQEHGEANEVILFKKEEEEEEEEEEEVEELQEYKERKRNNDPVDKIVFDDHYMHLQKSISRLFAYCAIFEAMKCTSAFLLGFLHEIVWLVGCPIICFTLALLNMVLGISTVGGFFILCLIINLPIVMIPLIGWAWGVIYVPLAIINVALIPGVIALSLTCIFAGLLLMPFGFCVGFCVLLLPNPALALYYMDPMLKNKKPFYLI